MNLQSESANTVLRCGAMFLYNELIRYTLSLQMSLYSEAMFLYSETVFLYNESIIYKGSLQIQ